MHSSRFDDFQETFELGRPSVPVYHENCHKMEWMASTAITHKAIDRGSGNTNVSPSALISIYTLHVMCKLSCLQSKRMQCYQQDDPKPKTHIVMLL